MIGLVDFDLQSCKRLNNLPPPNLEIMKLATYYKIEENKFCRLVSLDEDELTNYESIYFFSEQESQPTIPENFLRATNVIYGGSAFTNNQYIPFENDIIDYTIPRPAVYKEFLQQRYNDGVKADTISHILDDSYYRMYIGENKLPIPPIFPKKRVFIYDNNIFYPDWKNIMGEISERKPGGIYCIHPIRCKTMSQYIDVRTFPKLSRTNQIIFALDVPSDEIYYLLKKYKNMFLADITKTSNVFIPVGGSWPTKIQYFKNLIYKINLLYSFWSCGIMIKVKYEQPKVGYYDPMPHLHKLIESWSNNDTKDMKSINDKLIRKDKKNIPIEKQELQQLIEFNRGSATLFDQTLQTIKKGGLWRI